MRRLLAKYLLGRFITLGKLIDAAENGFDSEAVHSLRVELKRIRFLAGLIRQYVPHARIKKAYRPFKVLFEEAGKLRGEQVNLYRKAQSERGDESEPQETSKKIQKLESRFIKSISKQRKRIIKGMDRLNKKMDQFPVLTPSKYVDSISSQLLQSLTVKTPKKELHHNRHLLKGILYSAEIAPSVSNLIKKKFDLSAVLKLEDAIGDWHDLSILLNKARRSSILTSNGIEAAHKKRKEKLSFIYESISMLHVQPAKPKRATHSAKKIKQD